MSRHTMKTVFGFKDVSKRLGLTVKEVELLVKRKMLTRVVSSVFKTPAITRASYYKYINRKGLENVKR